MRRRRLVAVGVWQQPAVHISSAAVAMPKKGIHPMLYQMTVVLRNGASIQMPTTIPRSTPLFLREVQALSLLLSLTGLQTSA